MGEDCYEGNSMLRRLGRSDKGACSHARRGSLQEDLERIVLDRDYCINSTAYSARVQKRGVEREKDGSGSTYKMTGGESSNFHEGVVHATLELRGRYLWQTVWRRSRRIDCRLRSLQQCEQSRDISYPTPHLHTAA